MGEGCRQYTTYLCLFGFVLALFFLPACTKREFTITTTPPDVSCEVNGRSLGTTPVTVRYIENSTFHLRLKKEGFEVYDTAFKLKRRWFNVIVLDFFAEALPYHFVDSQTLEFMMKPESKMTHSDFKQKVEETKEIKK